MNNRKATLVKYENEVQVESYDFTSRKEAIEASKKQRKKLSKRKKAITTFRIV